MNLLQFSAKLLKIFAFSLLLLAFPLLADAQEKWTLQQCIEYAMTNNIQIKQYELYVQQSESDLSQTKANIFPSVNAGVEESFSFGRSLDPFTYEFSDQNVTSTNMYISGSVTLFDGLSNYNSIKQNESTLMMRLQQVEEMRNNVALNLATAYLDILMKTELLETRKKQLQITKLQIERTRQLVEAGSAAEGALLEVEAQAAAEELEVINAENNLKMAYITLKQFLELERTSNFAIEYPELGDVEQMGIEMSVEEIYNQALSLPQIKSAEYSLESSEYAMKVAKAGISPSITVSANYGTGYSDARHLYDYSYIGDEATGAYVQTTGALVYAPQFSTIELDYPFADQIADNASTSLSIRLNIPIFNNYQVRRSISQSRINIENAEYELQLSKNQLYKSIQQAHSDALAAYSRYVGSKKAVESMEKSFEYTEKKFNAGLVNSIEYNTAKTQLAKAQSDLLQAKYQFLFTKTILDFYAGNPISIK